MIGRDEADPNTVDRVAGWFHQIHGILKDQKYDELADCIHSLSNLTIPTQEEREAIDRVVRHRAPDEKTGARLASIFNTSVTAINNALVAETTITEDIFRGGLRRVAKESPRTSAIKIDNSALRLAHDLAKAAELAPPEPTISGREGR